MRWICPLKSRPDAWRQVEIREWLIAQQLELEATASWTDLGGKGQRPIFSDSVLFVPRWVFAAQFATLDDAVTFQLYFAEIVYGVLDREDPNFTVQCEAVVSSWG